MYFFKEIEESEKIYDDTYKNIKCYDPDERLSIAIVLKYFRKYYTISNIQLYKNTDVYYITFTAYDISNWQEINKEFRDITNYELQSRPSVSIRDIPSLYVYIKMEHSITLNYIKSNKSINKFNL